MAMPYGGWGGARVYTDEEREAQRRALLEATGGAWGGGDGGGSKIPTMDFRRGGDPIPGDVDLTDGGRWNPIGAPGDPGNTAYLWDRPELWTSPWTGPRPDGGHGPITADERRGQAPAGGMHTPGPAPTPDDYLYTMPDGSKVPYIPTIDPYKMGGGLSGTPYTPWTPEEAQAQIGPDGQFGGTPPPMAESLPPDLVAQIEARRPAMGEPVMPPPQGANVNAPGTLGGTVGLGQWAAPQTGGWGLQPMMGSGGGGSGMGSAAGTTARTTRGALSGLFGWGGGRGQAQTSALQSTSGYGPKAGQPYGMAPQAGPGYTTLGAFGGRQRY